MIVIDEKSPKINGVTHESLYIYDDGGLKS